MSRHAEVGKRVLDVVLAGTMLLLTLPIILVATIGAAISLRAWPFFAHTRIGRDGKPFRLVKIRTLPPTESSYAAKYDLDVARIPWFCALLRQLKFDELPQLALVVSGKMSLVGPRPEMRHLVEAFDPAFAAHRATVRPGCTGLWQVSERCNRMIHEHPEFDTYYLHHRSLRLDLWILRRTVGLLRPSADDRNMVTYEQLLERSRREQAARSKRTIAVVDARDAREDREPARAKLEPVRGS